MVIFYFKLVFGQLCQKQSFDIELNIIWMESLIFFIQRKLQSLQTRDF